MRMRMMERMRMRRMRMFGGEGKALVGIDGADESRMRMRR